MLKNCLSSNKQASRRLRIKAINANLTKILNKIFHPLRFLKNLKFPHNPTIIVVIKFLKLNLKNKHSHLLRQDNLNHRLLNCKFLRLNINSSNNNNSNNNSNNNNSINNSSNSNYNHQFNHLNKSLQM